MPTGIYEHQKKSYPAKLLGEIRYLYLHQALTIIQTASRLQVSPKVVQRAMERHHIPRRTATPRNQRGGNNGNWKGDGAGCSAFHRRLDALSGKPQCCEECGTTDQRKTYDWANLTGQFDLPADYKRLCRSCHSKLDHKERNFG